MSMASNYLEKSYVFDLDGIDFSGKKIQLKRNVDLAKYNDYETEAKSIDWRVRCDSENLDFDIINYRILKTFFDRFILTATSDGLSRYEKILGIKPGKKTLDERRREVFFLWNKQIRYTDRSMRAMLDVLLGKTNYRMNLYYNEYGFEITVFCEGEVNFDLGDLQKKVRRIIPANLTQFIRVRLIRNQTIYYGMYGQKAKHYKVLPNKVEDKEFKEPLFMGMATYHKKIKRVAIMPEVWTLNQNDMFLEVEDGSGVRMKYD